MNPATNRSIPIPGRISTIASTFVGPPSPQPGPGAFAEPTKVASCCRASSVNSNLAWMPSIYASSGLPWPVTWYNTGEPWSAARASSVAIVSSGRASRLSGRLTTWSVSVRLIKWVTKSGCMNGANNTALRTRLGRASATLPAQPKCCAGLVWNVEGEFSDETW